MAWFIGAGSQAGGIISRTVMILKRYIADPAMWNHISCIDSFLVKNLHYLMESLTDDLGLN